MEPNIAQTVGKIARRITGDQRSEQEVVLDKKLDDWEEMAVAARKELDWRWFVYDLWVAGLHYAKWDKATQQIISSPKSDGRAKVAINKTYATLRGVRSYVLQNRPKGEVTPYNMTADNVAQALKLNQYLDYLHDRLHLRTKLRATMWHALKYSIGWWQVLYDDTLDDGMGEISVNVVDPYDLYIDSAARTPQEARYMILEVRRNLADLKDDPKYKDADWTKVKADSKLAASTMKARMLSHERGESNSIASKDDKNGTVIVKEFWYKESTDEESEELYADDNDLDENGEAKKKSRKTKKSVTKIMLCTKIDKVTIRKSFDTGLKRIPFFRLSSDIEPLSMYGNGWVKNLINPNKLINRGESSVSEYNDVVNRGRYRVDKGAGLRFIYNQHGQIVETKRGYTLEALQPAPIDGNMLNQQIINGNRYMEDIGCLHDASMGRQSSSDQSGKSIEALQEGDSNNLSELVENTEEFLEDVYEYILEIASEKYQFARNIVVTTQTGEKAFIKVIGEDAHNRLNQTTSMPQGGGMPMSPDNASPSAQSQTSGGATTGATDDVASSDSTVVIPSKNIVDVKIASYLAYTAEGRRQAIVQLAQLPQMAQLPPKYILEAYGIGPIADIVKEMQDAQAQQQQQQMQQEQAQAQQQAQIQQQQQQSQAATSLATQHIQNKMQPSQPSAGASQAIALIKMVINGQKPEVPTNIGPQFISYLDHFMQSPEGQSVGGTVLSVLQTIRDQAVLHMHENPANVKGGNQNGASSSQ